MIFAVSSVTEGGTEGGRVTLPKVGGFSLLGNEAKSPRSAYFNMKGAQKLQEGGLNFSLPAGRRSIDNAVRSKVGLGLLEVTSANQEDKGWVHFRYRNSSKTLKMGGGGEFKIHLEISKLVERWDHEMNKVTGGCFFLH